MNTTIVDFEQHRRGLMGHCYRMLGSSADADDAVQETLVRAWRHQSTFEGRASERTWLYRIATNVCLDAIAKRGRRHRPVELGPAGDLHSELTEHPRTHWLEPVPDALVLPDDADPSQLFNLRESVRLAFVAALQELPAKQRAVLLLTEVVGLSAAEAAEALDLSVAATNSALQRARATLASRDLSSHSAPLAETKQELLQRYVDAFERYDVDALTALMREDATLSMPPFALWLQGTNGIKDWFLGPGIGCKGSRLVPTGANGLPAFGQYRVDPNGGWSPWALIVLEFDGDRISANNAFLDTVTLFPRFGLPDRLT
ncbi:MAG: sigma-70 family RNA polymerase sigma factor [Polyangiaceae bacterium]